VMRLLEERGATVEYHDPHEPVFREDGHERRGIALTDAALRRADAVVVITDHAAIDWARVAAKATPVVDTRNVLAGVAGAKARIVGLTPRHAVAPAAPAKGAGRKRPARSPRHR
jgi:UDP-N-acetyl-D-glucosamine dehydrogenase